MVVCTPLTGLLLLEGSLRDQVCLCAADLHPRCGEGYAVLRGKSLCRPIYCCFVLCDQLAAGLVIVRALTLAPHEKLPEHGTFPFTGR